MNKMILGISAAALLSLSSLAGTVPAAAAGPNDQRDQYIGKFCDKHAGDNQCNNWQQNHTNWGDSQYQGFYRYHRNDFGDNAGAALFGLGVGVAVGSALDNGYSRRHVRACERAYHSYDPRTDTYVGHDGRRHRCRL